MYSTTNKSDVIGEAHPGLSSDTRFGVLVPNQSQNQGRGGNSYRGNDRQNGRSNQHYGERGGYTQHLNRRGRRDMHFGRGQGRGEGRGDGRGHVRGSARGGRHFEKGGNHHNTSSTQNGNHQRREDDYDEGRWWGQPAPREILDGYKEEADRSYSGYDEDGSQNSSYKSYHQDDDTYWGPNGEGFPHLTPTHGQQAPTYPGLEETYPLILPPNAVLMSYNGSINSYAHPVPIEGNQYGFPNFYQSMQRRIPFRDYTSSGVVCSAELEMESHVGGHSPYFIPGHDIGVDVSMGSDNGREATNPRPRVVLPLTTPGGQTYIGSSDGHEGQLRANVYPPTPFGPSASRSPMRTTTSEGSPVMRPRRHATDANMSFTPLTHARTTSGSGTDLRRLATGNSGFAIAEPRSSPGASVFSPRSASPRHANMDAITARSSPGLSFSNPSAVGGPMTRNASSHELKYAGYSIAGQSVPSLGLVSRTSTPLANSSRRWFESRQFVPDGSRLSSPGIASPGQNSRIWVESRSEDGQM
ncbi:6195eca1-d391-4517-9222-974b792d0c2b [Sclerotinia trifoliorum]|uniref:6195eca1-d391-4517-9222-974b792d0c2b n=1 Tax=Sclerotinia trifoliorum TaxID=28548 RepID=A0A8H2W2N4_9HELO|nr:6195eca1-d391-4517-9222-974b792d0c2b [Sclerotinia trifoliorum]